MDPADYQIFSSCEPLFPEKEWSQLENAIRASDLHSLWQDHGVETQSRDGGFEGSWLDPPVPDQPGQISVEIPQEPDHPGENVVQEVEANPVGPEYSREEGEGEEFPQRPEHAPLVSLAPEASSKVGKQVGRPPKQHEVETQARHGGVEGSRLVPPVPDQPGQISGEIPQEPDHPGKNEVVQEVEADHPGENEAVQEVEEIPVGPEYSEKEGEGEEFPQRPEHASSVSLAPKASSKLSKRRGRPPKHHEVETQVRDGGVEGSRLDPPVPDQPGQISGKIPQEPDHPGKNVVVQEVEANPVSQEYLGKEGEGEEFPQRPEHAPPVSLAPEASSKLGKRRGRPPRRQVPAPVVPVPPRRGRGRPCKRAAEDLQNLPREEATQHSKCPKETRGLPEGWITEVKVREVGTSAGHKDKTYIETSTNKRCRSIPDVWRYIDKKRDQH